jgi:sensor histidine kinase YesM
MAFLEHYLAIQKIRFGDHLRIETQIAPEVKYASVPCFFVQPLWRMQSGTGFQGELRAER